MAEGYLRFFAGEKAEIFSAGIEAHGLNPRAVETMTEDKIDISHQTSNRLEEYQDLNFDFVITVCDNARENCPVYPAKTRRYHHAFTDPAKITGSEESIREQFRAVRNQIKIYCREFVKSNIV